MSVPNFSSLAGLEVTEMFLSGAGGGFQVSNYGKPNEVALELL